MSKSRGLELSVQIEEPSSIVRKLTIQVPAQVVKTRFEQSLASVQQTAKLKGFRPGLAPLSIVKQYYGEDIRHRVFHNLIDESFDHAVKEHQLRAVGNPKIDTPDHSTGTGDHDHTLKEDQDLKFTATFEVMPDVKAKGYAGLSLSQDKVDVTSDQVQKVVNNLRDSQAQLVPAATSADRVVGKGDFVDVKLEGGLVTESGVQLRDDMKGSRVIEVGAQSWIPGFEDQLLGMKQGETKTFQLPFPSDFSHVELAGKQVEFRVVLNEIKEKVLPPLTNEFAAELGYKDVEDLQTKAHDFLTHQKKEDADRKLRSDLLAQVIEKNPFDVPSALVENQTRVLAQDWAQELKREGFDEKMIQEAIFQEIANLKKRAENQVRASLILESVAHEEKLAVAPEEVQAEVDRLASAGQVEKSKVVSYYSQPSRLKELEFKLRQERTIRFLLDQSKIQ